MLKIKFYKNKISFLSEGNRKLIFKIIQLFLIAINNI